MALLVKLSHAGRSRRGGGRPDRLGPVEAGRQRHSGFIGEADHGWRGH